MKVNFKISKINFLIPCLVLSILLGACVKQDFKEPVMVVPKANLTSNITLAQLVARHTIAGKLDSINGDTIVCGVVIANDESGNLYKDIVIQDTTGGILIKIEKSDYNTEYKVGQRVYIKCKGLVLGDYSGLPQLGKPYFSNGVWSVGRIANVYFKDHFFKDSLPGNAPAPKTVSSFSDLKPSYKNTLVKLINVSFPNAGRTFSDQYLTTSTPLADRVGSSTAVYVRTSNYASFAQEIIPSGLGTVTGVLGYYSGAYQLTIRNMNDLQNFIPLTVILKEAWDSSEPLDWKKISLSSNKNWYWDSQYKCMVCSGYGGDAPCDDWLITPEINLTDADSAFFSFRTWTKYTDNGYPYPLQVLVSDNYSGGNSLTGVSWTPMTANFPSAHSQTWTSSGDINLKHFMKKKIRIAFRYRSTSGSSASTWEVDLFNCYKFSH